MLGGGYVGLEFAQPMRRFGSRVTVVERGPQLAAREDGDVAEALMQRFSTKASTSCSMPTDRGRGPLGRKGAVPCRHRIRHTSHRRQRYLVAAGRMPNTQGIGLDTAGIELDARGYIKVNERLETTAQGVWAMGDCAGSPQFTHVAFDDFRIVRDNLDGGQRSTQDRLVPYCMFTDPELGRVGLNEAEARRAGVPYRVAKVPMAAVLRTRTLSETTAFSRRSSPRTAIASSASPRWAWAQAN